VILLAGVLGVLRWTEKVSTSNESGKVPWETDFGDGF
jgi:hypothetical protein